MHVWNLQHLQQIKTATPQCAFPHLWFDDVDDDVGACVTSCRGLGRLSCQIGEMSVALGKLRSEVDQLKSEMAHVMAWMPWHSYPTRYAAMHDVANLKLHIYCLS